MYCLNQEFTDEQINLACNFLNQVNECLAVEAERAAFLSSKKISDHVRTVQHRNLDVDVISVLATEESLVQLAQIYKPNIEASVAAHQFTTAYPPSVITRFQDENQTAFGYTWYELSRLHIEFLMRVCNLDPIQAVEGQRAEQFWKYMNADTKWILNCPKIFGTPESLRTAKLIQHKQIIDLLFLKQATTPLWFEKAFSPYSEYGNQVENNNLDISSQLTEIVVAIINQLIDRPRAEDWLDITEFSKYTTDWLKKLWGQVFDEMIVQETRIGEIPGKFSIDYPFLIFDNQPVLMVEENADYQIKIIDNRLTSILANRFANELEVFKPELVKFFLTSVGVAKGGLYVAKAQRLADETILSYGYGLHYNHAFKKDDLFCLCMNYLSNWDNSLNLKRYLACELVDRFRWTLFPDACSIATRFPHLVGEPEKIQKARLIRYKKCVDLTTRTKSLCRLFNIIADKQKYPNHVLEGHRNRISLYIKQIWEQNRAEDWLALSSVNYDRNWLRFQMRHCWEIALDEWEKKYCDIGQKYGTN